MRSALHPYGLPKVRPESKETLRTHNLLGIRTAELCGVVWRLGGGFGIEQPAHVQEDDPSLFQFVEFKNLVNTTGATFTALDQCRFGGETTKPTWILGARIDFTPLALRCSHGFKTFKSAKGDHYRSPHPRVYGEWVCDDAGLWHRKSATLAAYPTALNTAIAKAIGTAVVGTRSTSAVTNLQGFLTKEKIPQGKLWQ